MQDWGMQDTSTRTHKQGWKSFKSVLLQQKWKVINARAIKEQVNQFSCLCILASRAAWNTNRGTLAWLCCVFSPRHECFLLLFSSFCFAVLCFRNSSTSQRCFDQALCMCVSTRVCPSLCVYTCKSVWPCQERSYLIISGKSQTFL